MEKKINFPSLRVIVMSLIILVVTFVAGFISQNTNLWFLPLLGGIISVLGEIFGKNSLINGGMSISVLSFFFLNYTLAFTVTNLTVLLVIFILMIITWIIAKNNLVTSQIKKDLVENKNDNFLREYEIQSTTEVITELLIAFLIAFLGSMIALYSYTDIFMVSSLAVPLAIIFSAIVFIVIYVLTEVLPKHLKGTEGN